ncbi:uncharacterized protein MKK02DRAFT_45185 [Dioszegia hungarica]|uniref:PUB domain-containing protein n=1 Tax=Dioszegia hungarica TaxID=4972 RepID=A0AA38LWC3_9TREE|nr:uncharacterized protein MKK02DRAFT_45185 [Dioszegia hungarica]KAI9636479.1 hypothetical protein MKK02DRAFT_45185 [Dioszegia hungarica]
MSAPEIDAGTAPKKTKPNPREAALLAAEARLGRPSVQSAAAASSSTPTVAPGPKAAGASTPPLFRSGSSSTGTAANKWTPTEKEEKECRIKFARLLDRGLVRDNGYRQVAEGVETLILIAKNVKEHDDPKYRTLKASNSLLKNKVLNLKGGHEYLIALGFRTQTIDFSQFYVFTATLKTSFELRVGSEVLEEHLSGLQARAANSALSARSHKDAEAARVAQALAQIEADRDGVVLRQQRDKIMRDREERLKREAKEKLQREEEERERLQEQAEAMGTGGGSSVPGGLLLTGGAAAAQAAQDDDDDDMDDDDQEDEDDEDEDGESALAGPAWGGGRKLGE